MNHFFQCSINNIHLKNRYYEFPFYANRHGKKKLCEDSYTKNLILCFTEKQHHTDMTQYKGLIFFF